MNINSASSVTFFNTQETNERKNYDALKGDSVLSGGIAVLYTFMNLLSTMAGDKYEEMQQKADMARSAQQKANEVDEVIASLKPDSKGQLPPDVLKYLESTGITVDGMSIDHYMAKYTNTDTLKFMSHLQGKIRQSGPKGMQSYSWQDVVNYMDKEGIKVDGKKCSDYIWSLPEVGEKAHQLVSLDHMKHIYDTLASTTGLDKGQLKAIQSALTTQSNRSSDFVSQSQLQIQKLMQTYNVTVSLINSMQTMLAEMNKSIAQNIR